MNITLALRRALQQTLMKVQYPAASHPVQAQEVSSVLLEEKVPLSLVIPACDEKRQSEIFHSAKQILERNHKQLLVFDLAVETFLKEGLAGVFGVLLREEGGSQ